MKYAFFFFLFIMIGYFSNFVSVAFNEKKIKADILRTNPGSEFKSEKNLLIPFYVEYSYNWELNSKPIPIIIKGTGHDKRVWIFGFTVFNLRSGNSQRTEGVFGS